MFHLCTAAIKHGHNTPSRDNKITTEATRFYKIFALIDGLRRMKIIQHCRSENYKPIRLDRLLHPPMILSAKFGWTSRISSTRRRHFIDWSNWWFDCFRWINNAHIYSLIKLFLIPSSRRPSRAEPRRSICRHSMMIRLLAVCHAVLLWCSGYRWVAASCHCLWRRIQLMTMRRITSLVMSRLRTERNTINKPELVGYC